jgi:hypothetical protein
MSQYIQEIAERERAEIIKNAEAACLAGEITKEELMQIRKQTAAYLNRMES